MYHHDKIEYQKLMFVAFIMQTIRQSAAAVGSH